MRSLLVHWKSNKYSRHTEKKPENHRRTKQSNKTAIIESSRPSAAQSRLCRGVR
jgi:hypothetical protein